MKTFGWEPTEEELKDMVNVIDQDGDGDISFNEFVWLMTRWNDFIITPALTRKHVIRMGKSKFVCLPILECFLRGGKHCPTTTISPCGTRQPWNENIQKLDGVGPIDYRPSTD